MNKAIYDAKRERDILDKVTRDAGPDLDLYARRFFEALFSLSRTYQSEQLFQDNEFTVKMKKAIEQSPTLPPQRGSVACAAYSAAMRKWRAINYYHSVKFTM